MSMSEKKYQSTRTITSALYGSVPAFSDVFDEETFYIAFGTLVLVTVLTAVLLSRYVSLRAVE